MKNERYNKIIVTLPNILKKTQRNATTSGQNIKNYITCNHFKLIVNENFMTGDE